MNLAKQRLSQTFRFLKELNELRNPVARDMSGYATVLHLDSWPMHPCISIRRGDRMDAEDSDTVSEMEPLIRIRRPRLTPCPKPPALLDGWLKPDWQSVTVGTHVLKSRNFLDDEKNTVTVNFESEAERVNALNAWGLAREKWRIAEKPALAAHAVFERIYTLWSNIQRDGGSVELVIADGMLDVPSASLRHPVLLQRVNLEFDPAIPEFRLSTGTEKVDLHRALLRLVPEIAGKMIAHFDKELDSLPVEPLGGERTTGFLRSLIQGVFTNGVFLDEKPQSSINSQSCIWRDPVLFIRGRNTGLSTTLDNIIEDLDNESTEPAKGLSRIVGIETDAGNQGKQANAGEKRSKPSGPPPDILFSKPANREQYAIAERLAQSSAVLVQGPPGTGKTHTIANLLGYLLAQGKSVLVTAHTTKALKVLRHQVDEALQPLCLSVLEGDADSQAQLSRAAQHIADRLSSANSDNLRREAGVLREKRRKLQDTASELRRKLRDARFSEVEEIVFDGEGISPIDAAKLVQANRVCDVWIPGPLQTGATCPLANVEVQKLFETNATLTPSDEAQLAVAQPAFADLMLPADFRLLANEQAGTDIRAQLHRPELWDDCAAADHSVKDLQELHQQVCAAVRVLGHSEHWLREVLYAGWMGGELRHAWNDFLAAARALASEAVTAHGLNIQFGPILPKTQPTAVSAKTLGEIVSHLEAGSSLGLMTKLGHRDWHQLIEACQVENGVPKTIHEFRALKSVADLHENRTRFLARWKRVVESLGGPKLEGLGDYPERAAQNYIAEIKSRLDWREAVWEPLVSKLRVVGFHWEKWLAERPPEPGDHGELTRLQFAGSQQLAQVIEAKAALLRQAELSAALQNQRNSLAGYPQSEVAAVLIGAQDAWNAEVYEEACRELARLEGLHDAFETRLELLARIEKLAPAWASAISQREKPHDAGLPPGDANAAWRWRQLNQALDARAAVSIPEIQERLYKIEDELRNLASQIIERDAWAAQRDRTGLQGQQALMGFVHTMRKIGKGTGKGVPELLRQARQLLVDARRAVPVWIMPLSRVYETFDARETKFDVVIIDEASQSDVTALAALYLGREHIVVGDKEQVTPDAVGQRIDDVQRLIATDLQGIPCSHLYDGQTSIYHLAEQSFGGVVGLREHFRCVPEIIQFSNHLSYQNIIPLREPHSSPVKPAMIAHRVSGFRDDYRKLNVIEAEEIASLVIACLNTHEYHVNDFGQPTSFGVISLLGADDQAERVEGILKERLPPDVYEKHDILCGNAAQFQGDERDVVFLSMVDGPPDEGQHRLRDAGPKDIFKKRYNVAVSRARNQLWVVHSLDPVAHLQSGDLRRRLIEHARDPQAIMCMMEELGKRTDSVFEKLVLQRLISAGYLVHTQWPVGARRIDLVVEGKTKRLAVECDGERWHTHEQLSQDLERQAILERLGWIFVRIRGSLFFRDPDAAMAPVFAKLEHLGIEPLGTAVQSLPPQETPLIDRVRRHAAELRAQWQFEKEAEEPDAASEENVDAEPVVYSAPKQNSRADSHNMTFSFFE